MTARDVGDRSSFMGELALPKKINMLQSNFAKNGEKAVVRAQGIKK
jgi:hypothetical protein